MLTYIDNFNLQVNMGFSERRILDLKEEDRISGKKAFWCYIKLMKGVDTHHIYQSRSNLIISNLDKWYKLM